jgi:hypothetical protein
MRVKTAAETGCKGEIIGRVPANDSQGMRYYPAFGVQSGLDARFRRYLSRYQTVSSFHFRALIN